MNRVSRAIWALLLLAAFAPPSRAALDAAQAEQLARDGLAAFDAAMQAQTTPADAKAKFQTSADAFAQLIAAGYDSAAAQFNLANAYYRVDDVGRAVLHYRRALVRAPGDARITQNLAQARRRVEPQITPDSETRLAHQLLFWHYNWSRTTRLIWLLILGISGWGLLTWSLWRRGAGMRVGGALLVVAAITVGVSLTYDLYDAANRPAAVIVDGHPTLRLGRGAGHDPALDQPLGPGVELTILQTRAGWYEVRLASGQTGWLPADHVERVTPPR